MRVLQVDPSAFTPPYDRSLCSALARAGADVELATSRFVYGPVPEPDGYEVSEIFYRASGRAGAESRLRLPLKAAGHPLGLARLAERRRHADLVHYQWLTAPRYDSRLIGRARRRPAGKRRGSRRRVPQPRVLTLHYPLPPADDTKALARERAVLERFDAVITHTDHGAGRLAADVGLDPERIRVIPHGPLDYLRKLPKEDPLPGELMQGGSAATDKPVILFFGLLRPYKGIDVLLEAFTELRDRAELWIAGMPRMDIEPLERLAARSAGTVRFVPRFIRDPEIPALMRRADILVLPYREIEQSGVLYTGLAFGKPMVLSDVGGFGEVVRAHGAGRLVKPGDAGSLSVALNELVNDPKGREGLADAARRAAAGAYSWDSIADRTLGLYAELLERAGVEPPADGDRDRPRDPADPPRSR